MTVKITVFLNVTPCNLVGIFQRFRGTYLLCLRVLVPWRWRR